MNTETSPRTEPLHALLAQRLVEATAALVDTHAPTVERLHASVHDAVIAVTFALSKLPRSLVDDGLGEVLFNEDTSVADHRGRDGRLVAMFAFDGRHAVLDAVRGHPSDAADRDAYLDGVAYVFQEECEARRFAEACALKVRRRAVADVLDCALELARPLPVKVAVRTMIEAFEDPCDDTRRAWLHQLRWTIGHPELDLMHRGPRA